MFITVMCYLCILQASESSLEYPGWAMAMIALLILFASLPVPVGIIHSVLQSRGVQGLAGEERSQELPHERYTKCNSSELLNSQLSSEEGGGRPRASFLPLGLDHYRLLPQQEELEEEDQEDTGV